ncbi:8522_t:CDS:2 [Rhizophagus irregularis]|nr:8522_t:CDS:2 [Rhizophagus irregularis]
MLASSTVTTSSMINVPFIRTGWIEYNRFKKTSLKLGLRPSCFQ